MKANMYFPALLFIFLSGSSEGPQKGDWVLIWCDYKDLFTDTGKTAAMPVQLTLHMKDGKVAAEQSYYDSGSMMLQLGWTLIPPEMTKK